MCLSCVGVVVAVDVEAAAAVVDTDGGRVTASLVVLDLEGRTPAVGDWVLVHTGFAVDVLDADVAREEQAFGRRVREASREVPSGWRDG